MIIGRVKNPCFLFAILTKIAKIKIKTSIIAKNKI